MGHDSIKNYKVLQTVFDKKGIAKAVDVNKLVKGKPMDNLEMLQWLKRFYDNHSSSSTYNASGRRAPPANKENESRNTTTKRRPSAKETAAAQPVAATPTTGGEAKPASRKAQRGGHSEAEVAATIGPQL